MTLLGLDINNIRTNATYTGGYRRKTSIKPINQLSKRYVTQILAIDKRAKILHLLDIFV
jgi:hypothetical protein